MITEEEHSFSAIRAISETRSHIQYTVKKDQTIHHSEKTAQREYRFKAALWPFRENVNNGSSIELDQISSWEMDGEGYSIEQLDDSSHGRLPKFGNKTLLRRFRSEIQNQSNISFILKYEQAAYFILISFYKARGARQKQSSKYSEKINNSLPSSDQLAMHVHLEQRA